MDYIFDTNIILSRENNKAFSKYFDEKFERKPHRFFTSVVVEGELLSLALQRNWGSRKVNDVKSFLSKFIILPIKTRPIINAYARIDAYSQGKLAGHPLPIGTTSRNMGKNDLWIAATTHAANATLVTTDNDFDHLDNTFLKLDWVDIQQFI